MKIEVEIPDKDIADILKEYKQMDGGAPLTDKELEFLMEQVRLALIDEVDNDLGEKVENTAMCFMDTEGNVLLDTTWKSAKG